MKENQKLQRGIYSFLTKQRLSVVGMRQVITLYAKTKGVERPKEKRLEWYAKISMLAQHDFQAFKKVYNKNKKDLSYDNSESYDDWWNECNLDGSFSYNGVTDDF
jgi:hypothetical protein